MAASFNVDAVRNAFSARESQRRRAMRSQQSYFGDSAAMEAPVPEDYPFRYVREVWSDFLIVESESSTPDTLLKVPYTVDDKGVVTFGDEKPCRIEYVALTNPGEPLWVDELTDSPVDNLIALASVRSYVRMVNGRPVRVRSYSSSRGARGVKETTSPYSGAGSPASREVEAKKVEKAAAAKKTATANAKKASAATEDVKKTAQQILKSEIKGWDPGKVTKDWVARTYHSFKPTVQKALRALYPDYVRFAIGQAKHKKSQLNLSAETVSPVDALREKMQNG